MRHFKSSLVYTILIVTLSVQSLRAQERPHLPEASHSFPVIDRMNLDEQMPECIQFSPDDTALAVRSCISRKEHTLTYFDLSEKVNPRSIRLPKVARCCNFTGSLLTDSDNKRMVAASNTELRSISISGNNLEIRSKKLIDVSAPVSQSIRRIGTGEVRVARLDCAGNIEIGSFKPDDLIVSGSNTTATLPKTDIGNFLVDLGDEIVVSATRPKSIISYLSTIDPNAKKPKLEPLLSVEDGCISFQKVDDFYIIGSNTGRLCFLGTDKKTEPLDANVLNMCIRQIMVHKGADGVYTCLVCGADEGNSFAVAFVDTKNRTIKSQTFKIAAKPAKVLAAISHDGKTFAIVDYQLKVSLYKAERFTHIK